MKGHCKRSLVITDEDFLITERLLLIKKDCVFFFFRLFQTSIFWGTEICHV